MKMAQIKKTMNKQLNKIDGGKIVLYKNKFEVKLKEETAWLSLNQMAKLFGRDKSVISRHLRNIFKEKELSKNSVVAKNATTALDEKTYQVEYFNLDVIISVGYRVNSIQGTQFRIWATKVLKQHLVEGYTINEKRLKKEQQKYIELKNAIALIGNVVQIEDLPIEAKGLAQVISEYTRALDILDDFDHKKLRVPKGRRRSKYKMTYNEALSIIAVMKEKFKE